MFLLQNNTKFIYIVGDTNSITLAMNSYLPTLNVYIKVYIKVHMEVSILNTVY